MPVPERAMTYWAAALLLLADAFVPYPLHAQSMPGVFVETPPESAQPPTPTLTPPPMPVPPPNADAKPASKPKAEKPAAKAKKPNSAVSALPDETKEKAAEKTTGATKSTGQSIAVLVNDEPITAYEIQQRSSLLALSSGAGGADFKAKAEARWKQITKDPKTNERFKEMLQKNNVTTKEEAQALQSKFVKELQQNMVEQLRREARSSAVAGSRDKAIEELVEEKLKLQEAKRLNSVTDEPEIDKIITGIAEKNKMTMAQFGEHMKGMGVDVKTMRARFRAEISWREVVRKRFGHLVAITDRDVDRLVATAPGAGEDDVELQLQRITLAMPAKVDQKLIAKRIADADGVSARYSGCANTAALAATVQGAKFEDLGTRKPATIQEPTRTLLLNARDGDMLPPSVGPAGIEIWAVCGRKVLKADDQKREMAQGELRQREFEILAKKHLKDLRQDAAIEYR
jgi:peptidyl-prolyl cis-trans isomerase SurA